MSSRLPLGWVMICGHVNPPQLKTLIEIWSTLWSQYLTFQSWPLLWERKNIGILLRKDMPILVYSKSILFLNFLLLFNLECHLFPASPSSTRSLKTENVTMGQQQLNSDTRECICHIRSHSCHTCATLLSAMYHTLVSNAPHSCPTESHLDTPSLFQEEVLRGFLTNFRNFLKYFGTNVLQ